MSKQILVQNLKQAMLPKTDSNNMIRHIWKTVAYIRPNSSETTGVALEQVVLKILHLCLDVEGSLCHPSQLMEHHQAQTAPSLQNKAKTRADESLLTIKEDYLSIKLIFFPVFPPSSLFHKFMNIDELKNKWVPSDSKLF